MCYLTRSVIFHPRDLVTRCVASDVISPSGPRVSFRHAKEQILLLIHSPQAIPLEYLKDTFQTTRLVVATDAIKAAADDSDYA
jgi:hypothetical protein